MSFILKKSKDFVITIEVVPPEGNIDSLMAQIKKISNLPFDGFSVASNPIAKPKMSAMVFAYLLQQKIGKPAILHFTIRDHNVIGLQGEMWGAKALGIETVIAMTGDPAKKLEKQKSVSNVSDVNVFELIKMSSDSGLETGAVLDFKPEINGLDNEIKRLEKKVDSGANLLLPSPYMMKRLQEKLKKQLIVLIFP